MNLAYGLSQHFFPSEIAQQQEANDLRALQSFIICQFSAKIHLEFDNGVQSNRYTAEMKKAFGIRLQ